MGSNNLGKELIIQKCFNYASVKVEVFAAGGIVGDVRDGLEILNCRNTGEICAKVGNAGGIIGSAGEKDAEDLETKIKSCVNSGYIHTDGNVHNTVCGGIIGSIQYGDTLKIDDCYNTGSVTSSYTNISIAYGEGGILGGVFNNSDNYNRKSKATIKNCYNRGNIKDSYNSSYAGQIIGVDNCDNRVVENCYYLNTATGVTTYGGTSKTADDFKTLASTLNSDEYIDTTEGYPILKWQLEQ